MAGASMDRRRGLPSVDALLRHPLVQPLRASFAPTAVTALARRVLDAARQSPDGPLPTPDDLAQEMVSAAQTHWQARPVPVINATGVILHTNLGRAPLSPAAIAAATGAAAGYSALEFDITTGRRGSRHEHAAALLREVTGAGDGLVVNNAAAALVLILSALCRRREVVVSRGQAVEIGGGFRIPAILRESGARLVEVGTTNRTRLSDYAEAIGERTAAILRVHASNFRIVGFTESVTVADLAALAHERGVVLIDDVGSGALLDVRRYGLSPEPMVQESIAAGADLVVCSGDKLLGGPQAGLIVGRADLVGLLRKHPLMRALRPDKVTLALLTATLLHYLRGEAEREIPIWRMIAASRAQLEVRARGWLERLPARRGVQVGVEPSVSTVGGGSLPGETLQTWVLSLRAERRPAAWAGAVAAALRAAPVPVIARIDDNRVLLDPRTVLPEQDETLVAMLAGALDAPGVCPP